ncbi:FAD binding domain protein [Xylaria sp. FL0043]|nr:FAD binding domain protein [Xylaria sp. FL0043]
MTTSETRLRVAIIGSGIAGLAAARILREKHEVTVYERGEPSIESGGQGIAAFPNGTHILETMGFDYKRAGSVEIAGWNSFDKNGEYLCSYDYDMRERYGAPFVCHMRVDFRKELLRLATAPAEDLGLHASALPAIPVWHNAAVDLDAEAGRVTLQDGYVVEADVVIVADGVHSRLRNKILRQPVDPQKTHLECCRVAVSADRVEEALGKLPQWWQEQRENGKGNVHTVEAVNADGTMRVLVAYPLRNFTLMNMTWIFPTRKERMGTDGLWHTDGDRDEILKVYDDFDYELKTMLRLGDQVKLWELRDLEPLPTWTAGRTILIGDAAHAMTPIQGQGGNMALEDADALRLLTQPGVTWDSVPDVLKKIDSIRRPRATKVLMNTRSTSTVSDRYAKFDEHCSYPGIFGVIQQQPTAA